MMMINLIELEEALKASFHKAIEGMGMDNFKKLNIFGSNHKDSETWGGTQ